VSGDDGNDSISTGDLADLLLGGAGNDTLTGGTGNDTVRGGAGDDTINYTVDSHGVDSVDGGADTDTLVLTSGSGDQFLNVTFNGTSITVFEGGTLANVESVTANLGSGGDVLVYESTTAGVTVNLALGTASGFSSIAEIESVRSDAGADVLTGDSINNRLNGQGNNDTIDGGGGNDTLTGGLGADLLTGGTGDDTFLYLANAESGTTAATRDSITDFQGAGVAGGDLINVNAIDANTGAGGNQNFTFIGNAAFSAAGQLRFFQDGTNTFVEANTTGVTGAEFTIQVNGLHTFVAADFVL
jgi:Ca2+-binding RTX toxin-like protein